MGLSGILNRGSDVHAITKVGYPDLSSLSPRPSSMAA
jgi:hypothetical protein